MIRPIQILALPRSRSTLALLVTLLYALFACIALYWPIAHDAPFVRLFGGADMARDAVAGFAQFLFWPLSGTLLAVVAQEAYGWTTTRGRRA
jgi:hypothetical protein